MYGEYPTGNFDHDVRGLYVTPFTPAQLYWQDYVGSSRTRLTIIGDGEYIFNSDDPNDKLVYVSDYFHHPSNFSQIEHRFVLYTQVGNSFNSSPKLVD